MWDALRKLGHGYYFDHPLAFSQPFERVDNDVERSPDRVLRSPRR